MINPVALLRGRRGGLLILRSRRILALGLLIVCAIPIGAAALSQSYIDRRSFDVTAALPAAPVPDSDRYELDRKIFRSTRVLQDTPRWAMAVNDVHLDVAHMMADFSCAVGIMLTPAQAPHLVGLLNWVSSDVDAETSLAKRHFKRLRPFQIDPGSICEPKSDVEYGYDYPSGHTTQGWAWGTILAEPLSDHAAAILARSRAFGESRIVCGVHNASAVDAGRISASATLSVIRGSEAYQADFAAARQEVMVLRNSATKPDPLICAAEASLVAQDIFDVPAKITRP